MLALLCSDEKNRRGSITRRGSALWRRVKEKVFQKQRKLEQIALLSKGVGESFSRQRELSGGGGGSGRVNASASTCVPLLIPVQDLAFIMRKLRKEGKSEIDSQASFVELYIEKKFKDAKKYPGFVDMLLCAFRRKVMIIIIDGVDEAAELKQRVERYILDQLSAQGSTVLVTSRPAPIKDTLHLYKDRFSIMQLEKLQDDQRRQAIRQQIGKGNELDFFTNLFAFMESKNVMDNIYAASCVEPKAIEGVKGIKLSENDCQLNMLGQPVKTMDELYEVAQLAQEPFSKFVQSIAEGTFADFQISFAREVKRSGR